MFKYQVPGLGAGQQEIGSDGDRIFLCIYVEGSLASPR
jgi:hypothetical protein